MCQSIRKFEKFWESLRKYEKVWESMRNCDIVRKVRSIDSE